jgi:hypothetical protein
MRIDRPLVAAVISLGWGVGLIIGYCKGTTGLNAAYPFAGSMLHLDITTTGPGAIGGLALIAVGALLLLWSFIAALGTVFSGGEETAEDEERYSVVPRAIWLDDLKREPEAEQKELWSRPSARTHI